MTSPIRKAVQGKYLVVLTDAGSRYYFRGNDNVLFDPDIRLASRMTLDEAREMAAQYGGKLAEVQS